MFDKNIYFDNNEGIGGFEKGAYDKEAHHPCDVNWTRQSRFIIPDKPQLIWKVIEDSAYVDETIVRGSFVVDREKNVIISDCDNNIVGQHCGRVIRVNSNGEKKEIFSTNMRFKSPVIGKDGHIYLTTGSMGSTGHKLYCLFSDGCIKWEFVIENTPYSKPVIDDLGNVYIFTYDNRVGTLFSIRDNGILNWKYNFNSINWHEPIISKNGIVYIGLDVNKTLCALDKNGQKLWERELGQGFGSYPLNIQNDGTIYACLASHTLLALNSDGSTKWEYKPNEGIVVTTPAIDKEGNLYVNLSAFRLVSLSNEGKEKWQVAVKGAARVPPIIGRCNKLYQQSSMQNYPQYKSWIETYSNEGKKLWTYEMNGTIISTVLASDNLVYALSNCHTYSKKGWIDKMDVKWELHAIGQSSK